MSFTGSISGYGQPLMVQKGSTILNSGNPDEWINNGDTNTVIRTNEI